MPTQLATQLANPLSHLCSLVHPNACRWWLFTASHQPLQPQLFLAPSAHPQARSRYSEYTHTHGSVRLLDWALASARLH